MKPIMRNARVAPVLFFLLGASSVRAEAPPPPEPMAIVRATGEISVDGDLSDAGWQGALSFDRFYETSPGDNIPAKVKTTVWLSYDAKYFYIGIKADDPEPKKIRAPYVDRDAVIGTDDNIAVLIDPRNDRKAAYELRVNPRGIQGDGIFNDANGNEDFSPDFFYDTAAKITAEGWQAEYRIPFSSLRYPEAEPQNWGILVWRNYPRDFRYAFYSAPSPRGDNCFVCHLHSITGFTDLPNSHHIVAAPYVSAEQSGARENGLDSDFHTDNASFDGGLDVKWNPTADSTIDGTINPDFSQIESDTAQISSNQRFALFFPEKRPFFLEGIDLFDAPIQAVYTRSITDPNWGLRATNKTGNAAYTVLVTEDDGGGLTIIPGPEGSSFALQDQKSTVALGRLRYDIGASFLGLMFTDREVRGGGYNRVAGPDFHWRPNEGDQVDGQILLSSTDPGPNATGAKTASGYAGHLSWQHNRESYDLGLRYRDYDEDFRADVGFVPQVGFREGQASGGLRWYPTGLFRFVRLYAVANGQWETGSSSNGRLGSDYFPGIFLTGSKNLNAQFEFHAQDVRAAGVLESQRYFTYFAQFDPGRRIPRLGVDGFVGRVADFDNGGVGDGLEIGLNATLRPSDHLDMLLTLRRSSLDVDRNGLSGKLFVETIERLRINYVFNERALVRLIGQYVHTDFDPQLYTFPVPEEAGRFQGSALFSYKLNWQTVLFLGYGDNQALDSRSHLARVDNSIFFKVSYAIQR